VLSSEQAHVQSSQKNVGLVQPTANNIHITCRSARPSLVHRDHIIIPIKATMRRSNQLAATAALLLLTIATLFSSSIHGFSHVGIINSPSSLHRCHTSTAKEEIGGTSILLPWTKRRTHNHRNRLSTVVLKSNAEAATETGEELTEEEIDESMEYLANLIKAHLDSRRNPNKDDDSSQIGDESSKNSNDDNIGYQLAKGRFIDLTTTIEGEHLLERLFLPTNNPSVSNHNDNTTATTTTIPTPPNKRIIQHAITTLQSLLIYGIQIGVKGSEETQQKMVRHLFRVGDAPQSPSGTWIPNGNADCIRRLKFFRDVSLGKLLLAKLIRKRTAQGAFDLLVDMGVWDKHVDTALLRSGFPVRFLESELTISKEAEKTNDNDVDSVLGIRRDLRDMKVYTVDSASTLDIDDGISVEVLGDNGSGGAGSGKARHRYWIHIADVDRWAPRGSKLLSVAQRRGTSLYLPTMTLCMFPPK
jgi:exoribonuclease R